MSDNVHVCIGIAPMGKARPRVTKYGTYMPQKYTAWKKRLAVLLMPFRNRYALPLTGSLRVATIFYTPTGNCRSDIDNAHAATLDALQDAGWIVNDRQVKAGVYAIERRPTAMLSLNIETIPNP